jgi:hypothetical protein
LLAFPTHPSENKAIQSDIRRKENEWNEAKLSHERKIKLTTLKRQQCMDFLEIVRKEEK